MKAVFVALGHVSAVQAVFFMHVAILAMELSLLASAIRHARPSWMVGMFGAAAFCSALFAASTWALT